jgi:hypothetical protein
MTRPTSNNEKNNKEAGANKNRGRRAKTGHME